MTWFYRLCYLKRWLFWLSSRRFTVAISVGKLLVLTGVLHGPSSSIQVAGQYVKFGHNHCLPRIFNSLFTIMLMLWVTNNIGKFSPNRRCD